MKIINSTSFLIIYIICTNANAGWLDKAIEESKKVGKDVYDKTKEKVLDSNNNDEQETKDLPEASTVQETPAGDKPKSQRLAYGELATNAGYYAGVADACGQSVGAAVRADLESRAAKVPDIEKQLMKQFDGLYNSNLKKGSQRCGDLADYRSKYEASIRAIGAEPVAVSAAQVSSPPAKTQGGLPKYDPGGAPTAGQGPKLRELKSLAGYAAVYAGRGAACDVAISAKIRPDFIAQIASHYPEYQAELTAAFDEVYPALADSRCDEMRLSRVKPKYESRMRAYGMTPVLVEAPKEAAAGSPEPVSAPAVPAATTKTSGDSNAVASCPTSGNNYLACRQAVKSPSAHSSDFVEFCKKCGF